MIEFVNATKIYHKNNVDTIAIENLNLKLNSRGFIFIVGKSGSGKSTLLNLVANYDTCSSGEIKYDGLNLSKLSENERDNYLYNEVGFVFQAYNLFDNLTVSENIALGLKSNEKDIKENILNLLEEVDLVGYENKKVKYLSGGEKQRVAIARALIKNPKIILCDEPCGNLDNINSKKVLDILKKRSKDSLVLIVSHSLNDAYLYADRIITLSEGKLSSDKFIDDFSEKDFYVINDLINTTDEEYDFIVNEIKNNKLKSIRSRKSLFKDYDDSNLKEESKNELNNKSHFIKSFFLNFKLINSKFIKTLVFCLIISLSLAIFSSILSIEKFNSNKYYDECMSLNDSEIYNYQKGIYIDDKISYDRYLGICDENDDKLISENYKNKVYKRIRGTINTFETIYSHQNEFVSSINHYSNFYSKELSGINVVDEDYLEKILKVDKLEYLVNNNENGIYITDYFADSMLLYNNYNKSYEELVNDYNNVDINKTYNYLKIKGVIKTNYKNYLKPIFEHINNGGNLKDFFKDEKNVKYYDFLDIILNSGYTYDENFVLKENLPNIYYIYFTNLKSDEMQFDFKYYEYIYSNNLPEDTILVSKKYLNSIYPLKTVEELEMILKDKTFEFEIYRDFDKKVNSRFKEKVKVLVAEAHLEYSSKDQLSSSRNSNIILSKSLYEKVYKSGFYTFGYLFEDGNITKINDILDDNLLFNNNIYSNYANTVIKTVDSFKDVFKTLKNITFILVIVIVLYFASSIIKDNKYNIGVLKSLGYKGNELSLFYIVTFVIQTLVISLVYLVIFYGLVGFLNDILIYSFAKNVSLASISQVDIISFNFNVFYIVIAVLLVLNLVISLIYLFILRKYKIIKVIQNKE